MAIETIKFSEMTSGGDIANNDKVPGLLAGGNVLFNNPWTFLPPGSTADRPTPSSEINYRLRFNTDDQLYEYYDAVAGQWTQIQESLSTAGPFVIYKASSNLPDAFNLGGLTSGLLKQTVTTGVATPAIAINGTDYYGPGFTGFFQAPAGVQDINSLNVVTFATIGNTATDWLVLRNGLAMQPPTLTVDGSATDIQLNITAKNAGEIAFNTLASTNAYSWFTGTAYQHQTNFSFANTAQNRNVTWQDSDGTVAWLSDVMGTVISLQGTDHQVLVNGTTGSPQVGVITLTTPQNIDTNSDVIFNSLQLTQALGAAYGGTGVNNGSNLLEFNGNITFIGAFPLQITLTAGTSIQFPTSGILLNSNLTSADFYVGNGSNIATGVAMSGDAALANTGAVTVSKIGGVGISLAGAFTTHGAFNADLTFTGNTAVTFPTSGTLATTSQLPSGAALTKTDDTNVTLTLGGTPATALLQAVSLTLGWTGQLATGRGGTGLASFTANGLFYASSTSVMGQVTPVNSAVLSTNGSGVPSFSTTLPSGLAATNMNLTTPTLGVASATSINFGGSALNSYVQSQAYTPTITFATPGNLSVSYAIQSAVYTKIGNIVSAHFFIQCTPTFTTASGNLQIPLPINTTSNSIGNVQYQASTYPVGVNSTFLQVLSGGSSVVVGLNGSGVASAYLTTTQVTSGVPITINGSITYLS